MDVPAPIDFRQRDQARAWANAANSKRPWRSDFFAAIAIEVFALCLPAPSVLELGSGPGFLAEVVVQYVPHVQYTLLDVSAAMHEIARARLGHATGIQFVTVDFKHQDWACNLGVFDAVVTVQAVHELRHTRHAVRFHQTVSRVVRPGGLYLVCDHVLGPGGMSNGELYMTASQQRETLEAAGFEVSMLMEKGGLVLHKGRTAA